MPEVASDQEISFSLHQIHIVAEQLLQAGSNFSVWAIYGELGAGKTTLIKSLAASLGVSETTASPTFSIVNEYHDRNRQAIYHFDFYRIKNETEAFDIGTDEYFDSGNLCLVEWPEKIPTLLPAEHFEVHLEIIDDHTRLVRYRKHG